MWAARIEIKLNEAKAHAIVIYNVDTSDFPIIYLNGLPILFNNIEPRLYLQ